MSGPKSVDNLKALIEPIKAFFEGVVWTLHDSHGTEEETFLNGVIGKGKIVHYYYSSRHNESRNNYLWCGPIKQGDWCVQVDELERLQPVFAAKLPEFIQTLVSKGLNCAHYYGKPLVFQYHESMRYDGNPHEGLNRQDGGLRSTELSHSYPNENDVRMNMRPFVRKGDFSWVEHYAKYYIGSPWGSNHCLLGNEARGDPMNIYQKREALRIKFRDHLRENGYTLDLNGLYSFFADRTTLKCLDTFEKQVLNEEKIVQDYYRFNLKQDRTVVDDHTWPAMKIYE